MSDEKTGTILIVDDDEIKRYTVSRFLTKAGFRTLEAATGEQALALVRENPELVILDVNLPDLDGFEVCRRIKADPTTSSVIVLHLSATLTESSDRIAGLEGGADGYLTEPVGAAELVATVKSMLRIREAERTARALAVQWQTTFDAMSDGVCLLDENDRILRCNRSMESFTGRPPAVMVGHDCASLGAESADRITSVCATARQGRRRQSAEYARGQNWYRVVVDPIVDEDGRANGSVVVVTDTTAAHERERERAELLAAAQAARDDAEAANRAKDEFLATMLHELRTPLNSMLGWITLLRAGQLGSREAAHALDVIDRNARSQAQLIADILDVSRIVTGKVRLDVRRVDLGGVVQAAADSMRPSAESKAIAIDLEVDPEAKTVWGDPERLQQVVWNLLSNAVKFTPEHGHVRAAVRSTDRGVEVSVSDSGVGIASNFLPFVFDRFRQADSSTTRRHPGLGLGLAIVKHLVELHGGTVRAESEGVGRGAVFTVSLPVANTSVFAREVVSSPPTAEGEVSIVEIPPLTGIRVMVVDDDEDTLAMLVAVLEHCDAEVLACHSAEEALGAVPTWRPDVLVSDIGMRGTDGYTLIRDVRKLPEEQGGRVPAAALTAYAQTQDRLRALAAGFQMFVAKPAEPAELRSVIASLAGRED